MEQFSTSVSVPTSGDAMDVDSAAHNAGQTERCAAKVPALDNATPNVLDGRGETVCNVLATYFSDAGYAMSCAHPRYFNNEHIVRAVIHENRNKNNPFVAACKSKHTSISRLRFLLSCVPDVKLNDLSQDKTSIQHLFESNKFEPVLIDDLKDRVFDKSAHWPAAEGGHNFFTFVCDRIKTKKDDRVEAAKLCVEKLAAWRTCEEDLLFSPLDTLPTGTAPPAALAGILGLEQEEGAARLDMRRTNMYWAIAAGVPSVLSSWVSHPGSIPAWIWSAHVCEEGHTPFRQLLTLLKEDCPAGIPDAVAECIAVLVNAAVQSVQGQQARLFSVEAARHLVGYADCVRDAEGVVSLRGIRRTRQDMEPAELAPIWNTAFHNMDSTPAAVQGAAQMFALLAQVRGWAPLDAPVTAGLGSQLPCILVACKLGAVEVLEWWQSMGLLDKDAVQANAYLQEVGHLCTPFACAAMACARAAQDAAGPKEEIMRRSRACAQLLMDTGHVMPLVTLPGGKVCSNLLAACGAGFLRPIQLWLSAYVEQLHGHLNGLPDGSKRSPFEEACETLKALHTATKKTTPSAIVAECIQGCSDVLTHLATDPRQDPAAKGAHPSAFVAACESRLFGVVARWIRERRVGPLVLQQSVSSFDRCLVEARNDVVAAEGTAQWGNTRIREARDFLVAAALSGYLQPDTEPATVRGKGVTYASLVLGQALSPAAMEHWLDNYPHSVPCWINKARTVGGDDTIFTELCDTLRAKKLTAERRAEVRAAALKIGRHPCFDFRAEAGKRTQLHAAAMAGLTELLTQWIESGAVDQECLAWSSKEGHRLWGTVTTRYGEARKGKALGTEPGVLQQMRDCTMILLRTGLISPHASSPQVGWTNLMYACDAGLHEAVLYWLEHDEEWLVGECLNMMTESGTTPWGLLFTRMKEAPVEQRGGFMEALHRMGSHLAFLPVPLCLDDSPLMTVCEYGMPTLLSTWIQDGRLDKDIVNQTTGDDSSTAFVRALTSYRAEKDASRRERAEACQECALSLALSGLVRPATSIARKGWSHFFLACHYGTPDMAVALLNQDPEAVGVCMNERTSSGYTPLYTLCESMDTPPAQGSHRPKTELRTVAEMLVRHPCFDPSVACMKGVSQFALACAAGVPDVVYSVLTAQDVVMEEDKGAGLGLNAAPKQVYHADAKELVQRTDDEGRSPFMYACEAYKRLCAPPKPSASPTATSDATIAAASVSPSSVLECIVALAQTGWVFPSAATDVTGWREVTAACEAGLGYLVDEWLQQGSSGAREAWAVVQRKPVVYAPEENEADDEKEAPPMPTAFELLCTAFKNWCRPLPVTYAQLERAANGLLSSPAFNLEASTSTGRSHFSLACRMGMVEPILAWAKDGKLQAAVMTLDKEGRTPFADACEVYEKAQAGKSARVARFGSVTPTDASRIITAMLETRLVSPAFVLGSGATLLHVACKEGVVEALQYWLKKDADHVALCINATDNQGRTAVDLLQEAISRQPSRAALTSCLALLEAVPGYVRPVREDAAPAAGASSSDPASRASGMPEVLSDSED